MKSVGFGSGSISLTPSSPAPSKTAAVSENPPQAKPLVALGNSMSTTPAGTPSALSLPTEPATPTANSDQVAQGGSRGGRAHGDMEDFLAQGGSRGSRAHEDMEDHLAQGGSRPSRG